MRRKVITFWWKKLQALLLQDSFQNYSYLCKKFKKMILSCSYKYITTVYNVHTNNKQHTLFQELTGPSVNDHKINTNEKIS